MTYLSYLCSEKFWDWNCNQTILFFLLGTNPTVSQNVAPEEESGASYSSGKFQQYIAEGNLEFVKYLSYNDLIEKMSNLDAEMEREIDDLRKRYHTKRQPILDAKDQKRKSQQNFWNKKYFIFWKDIAYSMSIVSFNIPAFIFWEQF